MAITLEISRCTSAEERISPGRSAARSAEIGASRCVGGRHSRRHWPEEKFHTRTNPSCAPVSSLRPEASKARAVTFGWATFRVGLGLGLGLELGFGLGFGLATFRLRLGSGLGLRLGHLERGSGLRLLRRARGAEAEAGRACNRM